MEPRLIRISAFVLAAVILLGSLSIWAVSTQDTATADVGDVYDINVEPNDEVENILSNTTISDDDEFGDINENKTLFTLIFDEDYPETYVNGTINLYNTHEISQYLHNLNLQLEANGEEVGWLGLSMGYARFEVSRELGETEMQISTTGNGGHTMRQAGEFELGFLVDINEKQKSVGSQEEITEVAEEYELRVDMNVDGTLVVDGETFDILPYEDEYEEDTEVELEAIPDEDVEFIEWDGIDTDDDNQTTITMDEDYDVTAVFETDVELTIDSTDGGEVDVPGEGTFTYDAGQEVNLEAVADEGHYFVEWAGDVDTIDDTDATETTIEMLDDYSITANFAPETYFLTVNIDGQGTVEVDGDEIDDGDTLEYEYGTIVDIEAIADDGWTFDEWTGDIENIDDPQSNDTDITIEDDYTITAIFEDTITTVMIGRDDEVDYEGDDEWVTYWSGTSNVDGLDEMYFRYDYELAGDDDGPADAIAGVRVVIDGMIYYEDNTTDDEDRTVEEDWVDVSGREEVEIEFLVYTETGIPRDSIVTIYEAMVESIPNENTEGMNEQFELTTEEDLDDSMDTDYLTSEPDITYEKLVLEKAYTSKFRRNK